MIKIYLAILTLIGIATCARYFPDQAVWYLDVTNAPLDPESNQTIQWLANNGGWGNGNIFQVDFSMHIVYANRSSTMYDVVQGQTYYLPDCDYPVSVPVPEGGAIEGQTGYSCPRDSEDCHLLVVDRDNGILYESYQASIDGGQLVTTCTVTWEMCRVYPPNGRGEQCTSSDAAGFPVIPLLFTADEVASGVIDHAIRFILPNNRIRRGVYVHPASHAGGPQAPSPAPIYGTRFRLKQSFDDSSFSAPARVVIQALKKYGMFLADGGNIALTAASDMFTTAKWSTLGFDSRSLSGIQVTDFEVVDGGSRIILTYDCVRNNFTTCSNPTPSSPSTTSTTSTTPTTTSTPPPTQTTTTTTNPTPSSPSTTSTTSTTPTTTSTPPPTQTTTTTTNPTPSSPSTTSTPTTTAPTTPTSPTSTTGRPGVSAGSTLYNTFLLTIFFFILSFPFH